MSNMTHDPSHARERHVCRCDEPAFRPPPVETNGRAPRRPQIRPPVFSFEG